MIYLKTTQSPIKKKNDAKFGVADLASCMRFIAKEFCDHASHIKSLTSVFSLTNGVNTEGTNLTCVS